MQKPWHYPETTPVVHDGGLYFVKIFIILLFTKKNHNIINFNNIMFIRLIILNNTSYSLFWTK